MRIDIYGNGKRKGIYYNDEKTKKLTAVDAAEGKVALQIFGSDPVIMAKVTEQLNDSDACIIDITWAARHRK